MSTALLDYEPLSSASLLRPSRPRVETYSYVQDGPTGTPVPPAVLPLFGSFQAPTCLPPTSKLNDN